MTTVGAFHLPQVCGPLPTGIPYSVRCSGSVPSYGSQRDFGLGPGAHHVQAGDVSGGEREMEYSGLCRQLELAGFGLSTSEFSCNLPGLSSLGGDAGHNASEGHS